MSASIASSDTGDRPAGLRGFARRHPIALFLVIVFGVGVPLMFAPLLALRGVIPGGGLVAKIETEKASALLMVMLALFPASLIVTGLEGGTPAVAAFLKRVTIWRFGAKWWATILLAVPVTTIVIALALGDRFRPPTMTAMVAELGGIAAGFFLVNLWEEISWAGFLQTRLERRYNLYAAAAITAVPFAGIHMPLQVINGVTSLSQLGLGFLALTLFAVVFRSLVGLVMRGTGHSLLATGVLHIMFNRSNNTDGIAQKLLDGSHRQLGALVATLAVTIVLGLLFRGRTGPLGPEPSRATAGGGR